MSGGLDLNSILRRRIDMKRILTVVSNILYIFTTIMVLICMGKRFGITTCEWWIAAISIVIVYFLNWLVEY
jgi:hypothetical protein